MNHRGAIIFGLLMGTFGTYFGVFAGLQIAPFLGTFFIFPGGILIALLFSGIGNAPFGIPLVIVLQIVWWYFVYRAIQTIRKNWKAKKQHTTT